MAYHSIKSDIYHLYKECHFGNKIEPENLRQGTNGKKLCIVCKELQKKIKNSAKKGR